MFKIFDHARGIRISVVCLLLLSFGLSTVLYYEVSGRNNIYANIVNQPLTGVLSQITPNLCARAVNLPVIRGIKVDPKNPANLDFFFDTMNASFLTKEQAQRMINYFFSFLAIPQDKLWVNLSPYEKDRVAPEALSKVNIGKDMLLEDYLLKQLTASLTNPKTEIGRKFWLKVEALAYQVAKTKKVPINTFHKIWVVPGRSVICEYENSAVVKEAKLKVMLEEDYHNNVMQPGKGLISPVPDRHNLKIQEINNQAKEIFKKELLPIIEEQVNNSVTFAPLRQLYYALVLAVYYKNKLKNSDVYASYINKEAVDAFLLENSAQTKDLIYQSYLNSFKQGAYNVVGAGSQPNLKRQYFSGGFNFGQVDSEIVSGTEFDKNSAGFASGGKLSEMFLKFLGLAKTGVDRLVKGHVHQVSTKVASFASLGNNDLFKKVFSRDALGNSAIVKTPRAKRALFESAIGLNQLKERDAQAANLFEQALNELASEKRLETIAEKITAFEEQPEKAALNKLLGSLKNNKVPYSFFPTTVYGNSDYILGETINTTNKQGKRRISVGLDYELIKYLYFQRQGFFQKGKLDAVEQYIFYYTIYVFLLNNANYAKENTFAQAETRALALCSQIFPNFEKVINLCHEYVEAKAYDAEEKLLLGQGQKKGQEVELTLSRLDFQDIILYLPGRKGQETKVLVRKEGNELFVAAYTPFSIVMKRYDITTNVGLSLVVGVKPAIMCQEHGDKFKTIEIINAETQREISEADLLANNVEPDIALPALYLSSPQQTAIKISQGKLSLEHLGKYATRFQIMPKASSREEALISVLPEDSRIYQEDRADILNVFQAFADYDPFTSRLTIKRNKMKPEERYLLDRQLACFNAVSGYTNYREYRKVYKKFSTIIIFNKAKQAIEKTTELFNSNIVLDGSSQHSFNETLTQLKNELGKLQDESIISKQIQTKLNLILEQSAYYQITKSEKSNLIELLNMLTKFQEFKKWPNEESAKMSLHKLEARQNQGKEKAIQFLREQLALRPQIYDSKQATKNHKVFIAAGLIALKDKQEELATVYSPVLSKEINQKGTLIRDVDLKKQNQVFYLPGERSNQPYRVLMECETNQNTKEISKVTFSFYHPFYGVKRVDLLLADILGKTCYLGFSDDAKVELPKLTQEDAGSSGLQMGFCFKQTQKGLTLELSQVSGLTTLRKMESKNKQAIEIVMPAQDMVREDVDNLIKIYAAIGKLIVAAINSNRQDSQNVLSEEEQTLLADYAKETGKTFENCKLGDLQAAESEISIALNNFAMAYPEGDLVKQIEKIQKFYFLSEREIPSKKINMKQQGVYPTHYIPLVGLKNKFLFYYLQIGVDTVAIQISLRSNGEENSEIVFTYYDPYEGMKEVVYNVADLKDQEQASILGTASDSAVSLPKIYHVAQKELAFSIIQNDFLTLQALVSCAASYQFVDKLSQGHDLRQIPSLERIAKDLLAITEKEKQKAMGEFFKEVVSLNMGVIDAAQKAKKLSMVLLEEAKAVFDKALVREQEERELGAILRKKQNEFTQEDFLTLKRIVLGAKLNIIYEVSGKFKSAGDLAEIGTFIVGKIKALSSDLILLLSARNLERFLFDLGEEANSYFTQVLSQAVASNDDYALRKILDLGVGWMMKVTARGSGTKSLRNYVDIIAEAVSQNLETFYKLEGCQDKVDQLVPFTKETVDEKVGQIKEQTVSFANLDEKIAQVNQINDVNQLRAIHKQLEASIYVPRRHLLEGGHIEIIQGARRLIPPGDVHANLRGLIDYFINAGLLTLPQEEYNTLMFCQGEDKLFKYTVANKELKAKVVGSLREQPLEKKREILNALVGKIDLRKGDVIVFSGDFVDRWIENVEVIEFVIALMNKAESCGAVVVGVMGNHDYIFREAFRYFNDKNLTPSKEEFYERLLIIAHAENFNPVFDSDLKNTVDEFYDIYGDYQGLVTQGVVKFFFDLRQLVVIDNKMSAHGNLFDFGFAQQQNRELTSLEEVNNLYQQALFDESGQQRGSYESVQRRMLYGYATYSQRQVGTEKDDRKKLYALVEHYTEKIEGLVKTIPNMTLYGHYSDSRRVLRKEQDLLLLDAGLTRYYASRAESLGLVVIGFEEDENGKIIVHTCSPEFETFSKADLTLPGESRGAVLSSNNAATAALITAVRKRIEALGGGGEDVDKQAAAQESLPEVNKGYQALEMVTDLIAVAQGFVQANKNLDAAKHVGEKLLEMLEVLPVSQAQVDAIVELSNIKETEIPTQKLKSLDLTQIRSKKPLLLEGLPEIGDETTEQNPFDRKAEEDDGGVVVVTEDTNEEPVAAQEIITPEESSEDLLPAAIPVEAAVDIMNDLFELVVGGPGEVTKDGLLKRGYFRLYRKGDTFYLQQYVMDIKGGWPLVSRDLFKLVINEEPGSLHLYFVGGAALNLGGAVFNPGDKVTDMKEMVLTYLKQPKYKKTYNWRIEVVGNGEYSYVAILSLKEKGVQENQQALPIPFSQKGKAEESSELDIEEVDDNSSQQNVEALSDSRAMRVEPSSIELESVTEEELPAAVSVDLTQSTENLYDANLKDDDWSDELNDSSQSGSSELPVAEDLLSESSFLKVDETREEAIAIYAIFNSLVGEQVEDSTENGVRYLRGESFVLADNGNYVIIYNLVDGEAINYMQARVVGKSSQDVLIYTQRGNARVVESLTTLSDHFRGWKVTQQRIQKTDQNHDTVITLTLPAEGSTSKGIDIYEQFVEESKKDSRAPQPLPAAQKKQIELPAKDSINASLLMSDLFSYVAGGEGSSGTGNALLERGDFRLVNQGGIFRIQQRVTANKGIAQARNLFELRMVEGKLNIYFVSRAVLNPGDSSTDLRQMMQGYLQQHDNQVYFNWVIEDKTENGYAYVAVLTQKESPSVQPKKTVRGVKEIEGILDTVKRAVKRDDFDTASALLNSITAAEQTLVGIQKIQNIRESIVTRQSEESQVTSTQQMDMNTAYKQKIIGLFSVIDGLIVPSTERAYARTKQIRDSNGVPKQILNSQDSTILEMSSLSEQGFLLTAQIEGYPRLEKRLLSVVKQYFPDTIYEVTAQTIEKQIMVVNVAKKTQSGQNGKIFKSGFGNLFSNPGGIDFNHDLVNSEVISDGATNKFPNFSYHARVKAKESQALSYQITSFKPIRTLSSAI